MTWCFYLLISSSYQVIVIPGIPLCNFNCYSLTNLSYFSKGSESDNYVTAEFSAKSIPENRLTFVLGDRLYYGGYYNAPLKPRKAYCIVLRTVSKWNWVRRLLKFFPFFYSFYICISTDSWAAYRTEVGNEINWKQRLSNRTMPKRV